MDFLKIAFLTPEYPLSNNSKSGGIGTSIKNLAEGLVEAGHKAIVILYNQPKDDVVFDGEIEIHCIKNIRFKGLSLYLTQQKIQKLINQLYKTKKIDLVEAPDWTGITSFIKPKKCPVIIRLNGSDTYFCHLDNRPVKWKNKFHEQRALNKAVGHISVSKFTANLTNKLFNQNFEYAIIPNGINAKNFTNSIINSDLTILYFGTLIRKKGLLELPEIFNKIYQFLPEAKLILIGKDSPDKITNSSSTWELMKPLFGSNAFKNVNYIGAMPYHKIKEQIEKASVCVFPSFAEALPVSWLEAMAMQKAIVASNIGWANEMILDDECGYLVNPKSHQDYASKVIDLLLDKEKNQKFGEKARGQVESVFDNKVLVEKNIEFYKKIIANDSSRAL